MFNSKYIFVINFTLFLCFLPISYSILKLFYGDIYFQNLTLIYINLFLIIISNLFFKKKIFQIKNSKFQFSIIIFNLLLSLILCIYSPIINNLNIFLFILLIFVLNYSNKYFINLINKNIFSKILLDKVFIFCAILFFMHFISILYHEKSLGSNTPLTVFFQFYNWIPELLTISLVILNLIFLQKIGYFNKKVLFIFIFIIYFSIIYDLWIITIFSMFVIIIELIYFARNDILKFRSYFLYLILIILIFVLLKDFFNLDNLLNFQNFITYSIGDRLYELNYSFKYITENNIFGSGNVGIFDENAHHSVISVLLYHNGILGLFSILIIFISFFYIIFINTNLKYSLILSFFLFLSLFTYSFIPPFFAIFLFIYSNNN